jgi:quinol monooxygenase YgiN
MVVLSARYESKSGFGDVVESALQEMIAFARQEEGCIHYLIGRSKDNPDVFLLYEQYESESALTRHRETPHFKRLIEGKVIPLLEKRERMLYTPVESHVSLHE